MTLSAKDCDLLVPLVTSALERAARESGKYRELAGHLGDRNRDSWRREAEIYEELANDYRQVLNHLVRR